MAIAPGQFCWYELMTPEPAAAVDFYSHVVGWTPKDAGHPDMAYTLMGTPDGVNTCGVMTLPKEAAAQGAPPCWIGYIAVDDVDAMIGKLKAAGGSVKRDPADIPGIGRFAVVADPHGAVFMLFKGMGEAPDVPTLPGKPGYIGWRELNAGNWQQAFDFYAALFGWTKDVGHDLGPIGLYQLFKAGSGTEAYGGMMTKMPESPQPFWTYYLNVDDIDAAAERVKAKGGAVLMGPHEVPGGAWILIGRDPQGAGFALIAAPR